MSSVSQARSTCAKDIDPQLGLIDAQRSGSIFDRIGKQHTVVGSDRPVANMSPIDQLHDMDVGITSSVEDC